MIRLDSKYLNAHVFSLLVLGESNVGNARIMHLPSGVFECKSLKIMLVGKFTERFKFKVHETMGMFISCEDGEYTLPITADMALDESETSCTGGNFIEVISRGYKKIVEVGIYSDNA